MTAARRRIAFAGGLVALSAANVALRWPRDTGQAHWSEWAVFYATPPFMWAAIAAVVVLLAKRVSSKAWGAPMPLLGIWVFALLLTGMAAVA